MSKLWVKFQAYSATQVSTEDCKNVDAFLEACKKKLFNKLGSYDSDQLSLSTTEGGPSLRRGLLLIDIPSQAGYSNNDDEHPLFITVTDVTKISNSFKRSHSDEEFIKSNNLDLKKPDDSLSYLKYHFDKIVVVSNLPNLAKFQSNCLEHRLDQRTTSYVPDDKDNVKLVLAVSGAGKTRMLLELLHQSFGYYFTLKSALADFGSLDISLCQEYCSYNPDPQTVNRAIKLLYLVRTFVCNCLIEIGFNSPSDILLAQLHPKAFFGRDVFAQLFDILFKDPSFNGSALDLLEAFPIVAIDEIQLSVESKRTFSLPGSEILRPFFSPLIHYSKMINKFPTLLLSGTGINFQLVKDAMESSTMKRHHLSYEVVSAFSPLTRDGVFRYSKQYLTDLNVQEAERIAARVSSCSLCHGRPRFVAFILDGYLMHGDIDHAIGEFIAALSNINSPMFPLRFLKRDLDNNNRSFERIVDDDTLLRKVSNAIFNGFCKDNSMRFEVTDEDAALAIQYGLGYGDVSEGFLIGIEIKEMAIVECLRNFIPFTRMVEECAAKIMSSPNPQTVGYFLEYLVAFAIIANHKSNQVVNLNRVKSFKGLVAQYLWNEDPHFICFPDHMCGPDIIYKCTQSKTIYVVQVKFLKSISKQQLVNVFETTDPRLFYCKRNTGEIIKGFHERHTKIVEELRRLQNHGYSLRQMVVGHNIAQNDDIAALPGECEIISSENTPQFFDVIGDNIWGFLDSVRK